MNSLDRYADPVYCLMRLIVGLMFACHGGQLVLGMFGGIPGSDKLLMQVGGWIQLVGGLLIAFGLLTRLAALICSGEMPVAYFMLNAAQRSRNTRNLLPLSFFPMKYIIIAFLAVSLSQSIYAQEWAKDRLIKSPRHGEWVDSKSGERTIKAFIVYPERKDKAPVVLVVHEIFGVTDWVRSLCDELAEAGVIAIVPDLLSGQKFEDVDGARKAISALSKEQVKADLDATADYALTKIPSCNGTLAICGFCWGGGVAFAYANENPKLKATYSFYGTAPDEVSKVANIACLVYGFYGENDERVNATIAKGEELMKAAGKKYEPVIYKGAGHGFMRSGDPANPNVREGDKKARDEAWVRWEKLLKQL